MKKQQLLDLIASMPNDAEVYVEDFEGNLHWAKISNFPSQGRNVLSFIVIEPVREVE